MTETRPKIRLFVDAALDAGADVVLRAQAHYLTGVMRLGPGDRVALFNGRSGEWAARIVTAGKREVHLAVETQSAPQANPPDLWLLFAPIKKARTDFIVEKAAELGAARICPVLTQFTQAERVKTDRLQAHAVEAAEQCGGTFVPEVAAPQPLSAALAALGARHLMFCDERRTARPAAEALAGAARGPWAVLIGPEGGFSEAEAAALLARENTLP
ncbi:MAG: 16S rRNA (uracil(1498)-N(3))-methyltransferase, partial [Pseudomonadota bacterium]